MNEATLTFVRQHANDDIRQLALRGTRNPDVDMTAALQQIAGRQIARRKLPLLAAVDGILYPPHLNMEQCSSEQTAQYKARLCGRLLNETAYQHDAPSSLIDLTGGFAVDFSWMSKAFDEATYVERNTELFSITKNNLNLLVPRARCLNADGVEVLHEIGHVTMIFLDPARRDEHGARTYGIADCTPDVLQLREELLEKADFVMLKLSPMLDWRKTVEDLGREWVREVHIVATGGECKELLVVLSRQGEELRLTCVNDEDQYVVGEITGQQMSVLSPLSDELLHSSTLHLYEPNAAIMKAGCFTELETRYGLRQLAQNSHLFVGDRLVTDFPGRKFQVQVVSSMNKRELKEKVQSLKRANITVRNFPLTVAELRKRLKLSEGGSMYIFATTLANGEHVLLLAQRVGY
jgi:hypothetical protein